ncbi:MAG: hypothetical protein K0M45_07460 [Candidatus Paracaedibacteraceae bacterium]|nr:hypothetical protein [Candidatus Paracaedibacteraceae bacterium]
MAISQPKITATIKKKVKIDWQQQLPSLTAGAEPQRFYLSRLVGPLMIGISFDTKSFNNEYYPVFSAKTLLEVRDHLGRTLSKDLMNSRINIAGDKIDFIVSISVKRHEKGEYIEAAQLMKEQALLPLEGPISISMVADAYQQYAKRPGTSFQMALIQDPALIAAWGGRDDLAQKYLDWGYETYKDWMANRRNPEIDDNPEEWLKTMQARIADPETLRQNVKEMIVKHKLGYLPQEDLILE